MKPKQEEHLFVTQDITVVLKLKKMNEHTKVIMTHDESNRLVNIPYTYIYYTFINIFLLFKAPVWTP